MAQETPPSIGKAPARGSAAAPAGRTLLDDTAIARALTRIAHEILERNEDVSHLYLVAIPNGGVPLARRLAGNLRQIAEVDVPVGVLDTTLYRDDLKMTGERPLLRRTEMPSAVDERVVVLVDDVVKTGRTIRAAMDALMDFGRPRMVQVVGLVDRGHRELPIKLDYVGKNVPTSPRETVCLRGRDGGLEGPLEVVLLPAEARGGRMIGSDLLGIEDLERSEIERILQTAVHMREVGEREVKKVPTLRGRTIVNLFFESSTRTRASFEIAGKRLSADVVNFSPSSSSMKKAESILDTARTLDAMDPDAVIVRHEVAGVPKAIADVLDAPVINAGDGAHEHPTQALLDLFTVQQEKGRIDGLTVTIVGDILHSRVARSNIYGFLKMGAEVRVAAPPPMIPPGIEELGVKAFTSLARGARRRRRGDGAADPERTADGLLLSERARVRRDLRPRPRQAPLRQGGRDRDAPGSGEPGRRALARSRRPSPQRDPRSGAQRRRDPHGGALPVHRPQARARPDAEDLVSRILLRGGRLLDPASGRDERADLLLEDGLVKAAGAGIPAAGAHVIEAVGCWVAPGFVDLHCHLREPGQEYKEDIASGGRAAVAGGFTSIACMANTHPVNDDPAMTDYILDRAQPGLARARATRSPRPPAASRAR